MMTPFLSAAHRLCLTQQGPAGILVEQSGQAYLARRWLLTGGVRRVVQLALDSGLGCLIRKGHPTLTTRHPSGTGADYLGFSPSEDHHWVFVLNMDSAPGHEIPTTVTFDKIYAQALATAGVPFHPQWRTPQELVVRIGDLDSAIAATAPLWDVLGLRSKKRLHYGSLDHFIDEEDLHGTLLQTWQTCALSRRLSPPETKVRLGASVGHHGEIDLLSHDDAGNIWVIELKNHAQSLVGRESPAEQLQRYMTDPFVLACAATPRSQVLGILIVQDTDLQTRQRVKDSAFPMVAFRASKGGARVDLVEIARSPGMPTGLPI